MIKSELVAHIKACVNEYLCVYCYVKRKIAWLLYKQEKVQEYVSKIGNQVSCKSGVRTNANYL